MTEAKASSGKAVILAAVAIVTVVALGAVAVLVSASMAFVVMLGGSLEDEQCGTSVVPAGDGTTRLPLVGKYVVSSDFGNRYHPTEHVWKLHAGIDMASVGGTGQIVAALSGKVSDAGWRGTGGNTVTIDHAGGLQTRYRHLSKMSVLVGQAIAAGGQVGIEGSTGGNSTGKHLHFETIVNGVPKDPRLWFARVGLSVPIKGGSAVAPPVGEQSSTVVPAGDSDGSFTDPMKAPRIGQWGPAQVGNALHIVAEGQARGLDAWTSSVAVMVAMRESSLENVDHGDQVRGDTIGLFQEGPERGSWQDRMSPRRAAGIFYTYLLKVPGYHDLAPTIAAHRAQANQDPYHYAPAWNDAVQVVSRILGDPDLVASLAAGGTVAGCDPDVINAELPAGPAGNCPATGSPAEARLQAVALAGMRCVKATFPKIVTMYGQADRGGDHATGNAVDFMLTDYRTTPGRSYGWQLAQWARAHARELGISYVIFDMKIWSLERDSQGWRTYDRYGPNPNDTLGHRDHVHVSW